ncbi:Stk1 family PASTA domain-containing Ser/Thr kinase [Nocardioides sp.]|uniref:Stk1 family PASTA domain-containing Ser/Thr kinase n=1 Tax=Nocardioides sp. TaxID=35761 RepID=UPI001A247F52|nr:Stk1 family PASTA domain-containing Ser/Thr kinase [Nocardioides sp.]MBJ7358360.1 Stk1 family PASTA domain-containing Ser/Thr kinase [Nocardioides sp.]
MVGGRYQLGELLGRGGMAEVRKGNDSRLGRVVAIKRLRTDLASDSTFQARFRREAQSAASLNHPAIVSVYDTGEELATDGSGVAQPYIVMEFVAGRTLRDILREGRKILPERALEITSGVLSALDYSHRAGIIHRDIKPGNVMLTPSGDVKVMDFGIARAMSDANTMTQTAAVVGTAQYLSPEQARGETVDSRSDVYSAGCLLYELLTGRPPFVGDSPVAVAYQHVREQAAPPSTHDADLPPAVDAIVMKALAKRLEDRYQSAAAMRSDIERYLAGRPVQAPVPVPEPDPDYQTRATAVVPAPTESTSVRPRQPVPPPDDDPRVPRTGLLVVLGLLVAALIAGVVYIVLQVAGEDAPEQEQVPNLIGLTEDQARIAIGEAGLQVGDVDYEASETVGKDEVIEQSPNRDQYVDPGSDVDLVVSTGKPMVQVPFVVGQTKTEARNQLRNAKLEVVFETEESDQPKGEVVRTKPAGGETVQQGNTVTVFVSDGQEQVPNVIGLQRAEAEELIRDAKFDPQVRDDNTSTEPAGTVTDQFPVDGTLAEGSTVIIFVSVYVEPPPTPTDTPSGTPTDQPTDQLPVPPARVSATVARRTGRAGRRTPVR